MSPDTTYYWKIVARNENGLETAGPVWKFTTGSGSTCILSSVIRDGATLAVLRQYRDNILNKTAAGRKIIALYYGISKAMLSTTPHNKGVSLL
jgi:hypothetical protein